MDIGRVRNEKHEVMTMNILECFIHTGWIERADTLIEWSINVRDEELFRSDWIVKDQIRVRIIDGTIGMFAWHAKMKVVFNALLGIEQVRRKMIKRSLGEWRQVSVCCIDVMYRT